MYACVRACVRVFVVQLSTMIDSLLLLGPSSGEPFPQSSRRRVVGILLLLHEMVARVGRCLEQLLCLLRWLGWVACMQSFTRACVRACVQAFIMQLFVRAGTRLQRTTCGQLQRNATQNNAKQLKKRYNDTTMLECGRKRACACYTT